jgi:enamine deaminase RidA (YjgF/YER057c/UK114 family)
VRLRIYVVRHADWPEVGRALGEVFNAIRPTNALVGVAWLVDPAMLVEIEAEAVIPDPLQAQNGG